LDHVASETRPWTVAAKINVVAHASFSAAGSIDRDEVTIGYA
jgi:hypothetical protein